MSPFGGAQRLAFILAHLLSQRCQLVKSEQRATGGCWPLEGAVIILGLAKDEATRPATAALQDI